MKEIFIKRFENFLKKHVRVYNLDAFIEDLISQYGNSGLLQYELHSSESNDKRVHLFDFTAEEINSLLEGGL